MEERKIYRLHGLLLSLVLFFFLHILPGECVQSKSSSISWGEPRGVSAGKQPWVFPTRVSEVSRASLVVTQHPTENATLEYVVVPLQSEKEETVTKDKQTFGLDNHISFSSDNHLSALRYDLEPTVSQSGSLGRIQPTQGEGERAPRARLVGPENSARPTIGTAPDRSQDRKSDPDIQDFISGFVKLFNGGSPNAPPPIRRRINNRGPPRISEVPPFVLDPQPSLVPPPPPHPMKEMPPYPFEKPDKVVIKPYVTGVPLPEQIVPASIKPSKPPMKIHKLPPSKTIDNKKSVTTYKPNLNLPLIPTPTLIQPSTSLSKTKTPVIDLTTIQTTTTTSTTEKTETTTTSATTTTEAVPTTPELIKQIQNETVNSTPDTPRLNLTQLFPNTTELLFDSTKKQESSAPSMTAGTYSSSLPSSRPAPPSLPIPVKPTPVLESSITEPPSSKESQKTTKWDQPSSSKPYKGYSARPGIVLDDPEYKPGGKPRPIITGTPVRGEVFDVTVSAIQGPGGTGSGAPPTVGTAHIYPVELEGVELSEVSNSEVSVITKAQAGQHYVSIDGKRTYINLFSSSTSSSPQIKPTSTQKAATVKTNSGSYSVHQSVKPVSRPGGGLRRPQPPVRIDTCIVGDLSTCDADQHETCKTDHGVSSCHCAPAFSRLSHRQPCKRIVSLFTSVHVEKLYDKKVSWSDKLVDNDSQEYLQLEYEAIRAMESALSMTPFSDAYMGSKLNNVYTPRNSEVFLNMTLELESSAETLRPQVRQEIEKHLLGAIRRRNNNLGTSPVWVSETNPVLPLQDLDECSAPELNDCYPGGECSNTFGSFECTCPGGFKDEHASNPLKAGRRCETCGPDYCNHRGTCSYNQQGQQTCTCTGNYYGSQCEVDGEVLGVAIGASIAAVLIILSTLVCLCMWSRKWNKEQKAIGLGSPVFGYMPSGGSTVKTPGVGAPPYQVSMEDRLRWAQIADAMAQATNHYAPEPVGVPTRPSSAMFGYGTLPVAPIPLPRLGMRPPASVHNMNLRQESSSEEDDRVDLLSRNFHVPRPKSRSSIANQSGIYYDVDYEQQDHMSTMKHPPIPLSTYTMGRAHYYRT